MDIVCFDMEGTLTPEIWEQVALDTGLDELNKTTRDIPSYADLMDYRLGIMKKHNLKLADVLVAAKKLDLLEGALDFLQEVRKHFQVVILSDTFHEFAFPLMEKMGHPLLLCHTLNVDGEGNILGYSIITSKAYKAPIPTEFSQDVEWLNKGLMTDAEYHNFYSPINIKTNFEQIESLLPEKYSPLNNT